MSKRILCYAIASLLSFGVYGQYTYESEQDLYHLQTNANNFEGELAYSVSDDGISPAIDLSFDFTFYGSTFSQARMATNGCLHFGSSGSYCNDYTPDPINGQHTYTIYAFWTDLIRDNNSRMKSWGDSSKMIFGWYDLREYNRASDNSFEIILWNNNSFDLRYGHLDIINHDVLIGEVGANKDNSYTYYYHDECSTGTTNSSSCVNKNWNETSINTTLENGGSLYGSGSGNNIDCSNPLNNTSCTGYAEAYQTQQCDIDQLYSNSCPYYWEAYDDLQCSLDPQYGPFCQGYRQEESIAYFQEEELFDYGYEEYDSQYDVFEEPPMFEEFFYQEPEFVFDEEIIFEQIFLQEEYYDPFESIHNLSTQEEELFIPIEDLMLEEFIFQETFLVEDFREPDTFIELETIEELEEWFEEETAVEEEVAHAEEPEEEFIEEIFEEEVVEEVFEEMEEMEEERLADAEEELTEENFDAIEKENTKGKRSTSREVALRVVASTIRTANQSVSDTNAGNSIHATGNSVAAGNAVSNSSTAGFSTSSSPSMSDQFASSTAQTNQVLSMSFDSSNISSTAENNISATSISSGVVVNDKSSAIDSSIDFSSGSDLSASDSDKIAENILDQNMKDAQQDVMDAQEQTGQYGSEDIVISYIGFLPGFNSYRAVSMPEKEFWYEPKSIYTNNTILDNNAAFYSMSKQSINTLTDLKNMQPNL